MIEHNLKFSFYWMIPKSPAIKICYRYFILTHALIICSLLSTADNSSSKSPNCSIIVFPMAIAFYLIIIIIIDFCALMFCTLNLSPGCTLINSRSYSYQQHLIQRPWLCKCSLYNFFKQGIIDQHQSKTSVLQFGNTEKRKVLSLIILKKYWILKKYNSFPNFRTFRALTDKNPMWFTKLILEGYGL